MCLHWGEERGGMSVEGGGEWVSMLALGRGWE
jgi:hypothetical protein